MLCLYLHASAYFCICYAYGAERQRHSRYTHPHTRIYRNMPMHADMPKSLDVLTKIGSSRDEKEMADSVTNYLKDAYTNSVRPHPLVA
jgi:hypothetical protein